MSEDTKATTGPDRRPTLETRVRDQVLPILFADRFRFVLGVVLALVLLVVGAILAFAAGPLPTWIREQLGSLLPALSVSLTQALLAGILAGAGLLFLRYSTTMDGGVGFLVDGETPVETPATAPRIVGEAFDRDLGAALDAVRLKRVAHDATTPHRTLRGLAVRITELSENCSTDEATRTIETGEWTADPIAKAFCSETIPYPVRFRLVLWARPDLAYERAVTRTSAAVSRYAQTTLGPDATRDSPPADDEARSPDWLERLASGLLGEPTTAAASADDPATPQPEAGSRSQPAGTRGDD